MTGTRLIGGHDDIGNAVRISLEHRAEIGMERLVEADPAEIMVGHSIDGKFGNVLIPRVVRREDFEAAQARPCCELGIVGDGNLTAPARNPARPANVAAWKVRRVNEDRLIAFTPECACSMDDSEALPPPHVRAKSRASLTPPVQPASAALTRLYSSRVVT